MTATDRKILERRVMRRWGKLRKQFDEGARFIPRHLLIPKALSNACLHSLIDNGHPCRPHDAI